VLELWRLLGRPARQQLALALLLSACAGAFGVVLLGLSGWFLTAAAIAGAAGSGYVFNHLYPSAGVRAAAFGRVLTRYGEQLLGHDATLGISARLRPQLFAAAAHTRRGLAPMPASELGAIVDDVEAAETGFLRVMSPLSAIVASACVALGFAFAADPVAGVIACLVMALAAVVLPMLVVRRSRAQAAALSTTADAGRERTARLVENAVELDTVGAIGVVADDVQASLDEWQQEKVHIDLPFRRMSTLTGAAGSLLALFVLWRVTAEGGGLAIGVGAALALIAAFDAAAAMVSVLSAASRSRAAALRLADRLRHDASPWNPPVSAASTLRRLFPIRADNLLIRPADDAHDIGPLSFEIGAGEVVQFVGESGCGKSTLAETLMRLHPVAGGRLTYAGIPAEALRIAAVLERIAAAPQFPAFLPGRLLDQLRLGRPDASRGEVEAALSTACARDFLDHDPGRLEASIDERTLPFSGGELRRLGIARALIAEPDLLIVDEPFAGLDAPLARELAERLAAWAAEGGRSLLVLGHEEMPELAGIARTVSMR
jgi:ATP-binding cassette subfamily C protein CydC